MKKLVGAVVRKLIDVIDIIIIMVLLGFIISRFFGGDFIAPAGVWVCEELGITIDFDDRVDKSSSNKVRAWIIIDEEIEEIICFTSYMGDCGFYHIEDARDAIIISNCILGGSIKGKGENKLIFYTGEEKYIFVRQE